MMTSTPRWAAGLDAVGRAEKHQPGEQEDRGLQRPEDVAVEDVAGDDVGEGDDRHQPEDERDQRLFDRVQQAAALGLPSSHCLPARLWKDGRRPVNGRLIGDY